MSGTVLATRMRTCVIRAGSRAGIHNAVSGSSSRSRAVPIFCSHHHPAIRWQAAGGGEKVSYLIGSSKDGKPCAVQVFFPDRPLSLAGGPMPSMPDRGSREDLSPRAPHATTYRTREYHAPRRKGSWGGKLIPYWCWRGCSPYSRFSAEFASLPSFPFLARRTVLRTVRFRFRLLFVSAMAVSIAPR